MKNSTRPPAFELGDDFDDSSLDDVLPPDDAALADVLPSDAAALRIEPLDDEDDKEEDVDQEDEEIVAYLDDELSPEERAAFERRLAENADLRRRVDEERSAWDALELLDADPPDASLTEATVERLNSETQNEFEALEKAKKRRRRSRRTLEFGFAALLAVVGFFAFALFFPDVSTRRERDCRVVERLAQLEVIGDFDFLTALDRADLFDEPRAEFFVFGDGTSFDRTPEKTPSPSPAPSPTTPRTFAELSQDRVFYRLQEKFERLTPEARESFRRLYRQIAAAPDADRLWRVLDNYCVWFFAWPNENDRERFLTLPVDRRIAEIQRLTTAFKRPIGTFAQRSVSNTSNVLKALGVETFESSPTVQALRKSLPKELRSENLVPLYQKYAQFLQKSGRERDGEQRREGILEFLSATPTDELLVGLSPKAQEYLVRLSEEERSPAFGLLVSLSVCEQEERSFKETRPFQNFGRGFGGRANAFGGALPNPFDPFDRCDSIQELAETLRNVPQEVRDFLTSRPAAEMRGRLWAIRWGFSQFRSPKNASNFAFPFPDDETQPPVPPDENDRPFPPNDAPAPDDDPFP